MSAEPTKSAEKAAEIAPEAPVKPAEKPNGRSW